MIEIPAVASVDRNRSVAKWTVRKYNDGYPSPYEIVVVERNLMLNEGITEMLKLLAGLSATAYSNANARLGVGDGAPSSLTGTLSFTNGSTAVTGSGTAFTTELAVNDWIYPTSQGSSSGSPPVTKIAAKVASITNNTNLVLATNFAGTTAAGVGASKILREIATQTDLQGTTNKLFVGMSSGYPSVTNQTISWRSSFSTAQANFAWNEIGVDNGSGAGLNLNRKIDILGTKTSSQIWELTLNITFS